MKKNAFVLGLISFISPIPVFVFTILWCWTWAFGIGMGLLGYDGVPSWILLVGLSPLLISPLLGLFGVFYGICRRKERLAWLGILLSVLCIVANALLIYGLGYIGSRY